MATLMKIAYLLAAAAAVCHHQQAAAANVILNNAASGANVGNNGVVIAREVIPAGDDALPSIEVFRTAGTDGTLTSTFPFAAYPNVTAACPAGMRTPVVVYAATSMAEVAVETPLRMFFVCPRTTNSPLGALYSAVSSNKGQSWEEPVLMRDETTPDAHLPYDVALKGVAPMIASTTNAARWLLPVQTAACSASYIVLSNYGDYLNVAASAASSVYCADDNSGAEHDQVSSSTWLRAPLSEATGTDLNRLVLLSQMSDGVTTAAVSCDLTGATDCSVGTNWAPYTTAAGTAVTGTIATGTVPSVMAAANYAATANPSPAPECVATSNTIAGAMLIAAQNVIPARKDDDKTSFLTFELAGNISAVMTPSERTLVGAVFKKSVAAADVTGVVTIPLTPIVDAETSVCTQQWAYFVTVAGASSAPITGTFSSKAADPNTNADTSKPEDNGNPALAASITFIIIGSVCVILAVIFVVGYIRRKNDPADLDDATSPHADNHHQKESR